MRDKVTGFSSLIYPYGLSADHFDTLPNKSGKFALLSDVTAATPTLTLTQVLGYGNTTNLTATFNSSGITTTLWGNFISMSDVAGNQFALQKNQLIFEPISGATSSYGDGEMRIFDGTSTETDAGPGSVFVTNSSYQNIIEPNACYILNNSEVVSLSLVLVHLPAVVPAAASTLKILLQQMRVILLQRQLQVLNAI